MTLDADASLGAGDGRPGATDGIPTPFWTVAVVHSDPRTRAQLAALVDATPRLRLRGTVASGSAALSTLSLGECDLLILDVNRDREDPVCLIQRLRSASVANEIIIVTGVHSSATVRAALHAGALDYIVTPLDVERVRSALGMFLTRASALRVADLDQDAIDRAYGAGRLPGRWLPSGLSEDGLVAVRDLLSHGTVLSAADAASITGLSRVTTRRYLEYLVDNDQAICMTLPAGPGRPRKLYRAPDVGPALG